MCWATIGSGSACGLCGCRSTRVPRKRVCAGRCWRTSRTSPCVHNCKRALRYGHAWAAGATGQSHAVGQFEDKLGRLRDSCEDGPLAPRTVIDNSRRDTSGRTSSLNGKELLETGSDSYFEGSGCEPVSQTELAALTVNRDSLCSALSFALRDAEVQGVSAAVLALSRGGCYGR